MLQCTGLVGGGTESAPVKSNKELITNHIGREPKEPNIHQN